MNSSTFLPGKPSRKSCLCLLLGLVPHSGLDGIFSGLGIVTNNTSFNRMDPQSRVLLHAAHAAMEDAGYAEDSTPSFQRKSFGCYIGAATGDYTDNLRNDIDVYYSPGKQHVWFQSTVRY